MLSGKIQISDDTHFDIYALFPNTKMNIIYYSLKHMCIYKYIKMEQKIYVFSLHFLLVVGYKGQTTDGGQRKHQPSLGALFLSFKLGCCKERKTSPIFSADWWIYSLCYYSLYFWVVIIFLRKKIPWQIKNTKSLNMIIYVLIYIYFFKSQHPFNASSIYIKITF